MSIIGKWNVAFQNTCIIVIGAAKALSCNKLNFSAPSQSHSKMVSIPSRLKHWRSAVEEFEKEEHYWWKNYSMYHQSSTLVACVTFHDQQNRSLWKPKAEQERIHPRNDLKKKNR